MDTIPSRTWGGRVEAGAQTFKESFELGTGSGFALSCAVCIKTPELGADDRIVMVNGTSYCTAHMPSVV